MPEIIAKPVANDGGALISAADDTAVTIISVPQSHIGARHMNISLGGANPALLSVDGGVTYPYYLPGAVTGYPTVLRLDYTIISGNIKAINYTVDGAHKFTNLWVTIS